jgi:predicted DsbA family dithiol-disulfide isomerase
VKIDVFQDTVCPWCRIGKAHLQQALADWDHEQEPVEINYRTFFLDPGVPVEGRPFREHMSAKGGGRIPLERFFAGPRQAGAAVGLEFNFEQIEVAPNTMLSHRLIALAPADQKEAIIDAIFTAYFEEGQDIGKLDVLLDIAAAQGLDREETEQALEGDEGTAEVLADVQQARAAGITGVPFFVINDQYAFSGAQPPHLITRLLQQVADAEPIVPA